MGASHKKRDLSGSGDERYLRVRRGHALPGRWVIDQEAAPDVVTLDEAVFEGERLARGGSVRELPPEQGSRAGQDDGDDAEGDQSPTRKEIWKLRRSAQALARPILRAPKAASVCRAPMSPKMTAAEPEIR